MKPVLSPSAARQQILLFGQLVLWYYGYNGQIWRLTLKSNYKEIILKIQ